MGDTGIENGVTVDTPEMFYRWRNVIHIAEGLGRLALDLKEQAEKTEKERDDLLGELDFVVPEGMEIKVWDTNGHLPYVYVKKSTSEDEGGSEGWKAVSKDEGAGSEYRKYVHVFRTDTSGGGKKKRGTFVGNRISYDRLEGTVFVYSDDGMARCPYEQDMNGISMNAKPK